MSQHLHEGLGHLLATLGDGHPGHAGQGARRGISPDLGRHAAIGQQPGGAHLDQRLVPARPEGGRQGVPLAFERSRQQGEQTVAAGVARDADGLVRQRAPNDLGPSTDPAQDLFGGGEDLVEEALVEVVAPEHGPDGAHFDALAVHRD